MERRSKMTKLRGWIVGAIMGLSVSLAAQQIVAPFPGAPVWTVPASAINGGGISNITLIAPEFCLNVASQDVYIGHVGTNDMGIYTNATACASGTLRFDVSATAVTSALNIAAPSITLGTSGNLIGGTDLVELRDGTNAQVFRVYNTFTSAISNERFAVDWQTLANTDMVGNRTAATGSSRALVLVSQSVNGGNNYAALQISRTGAPFIQMGLWDTSGAFNNTTALTGTLFNLGQFTSSAPSGTVITTSVTPTYNQTTSTAANTDFLINRTETSIGSGAQNLIDMQIAGVSKFRVERSGAIVTGGTGMVVANVGANSCGTTTATIAGNNTLFTITVGATAGTQCRVTFTVAAPTTWGCTANDDTTTVAVRPTPVDTTHVDFIGTFTAGDNITALCVSR